MTTDSICPGARSVNEIGAYDDIWDPKDRK